MLRRRSNRFDAVRGLILVQLARKSVTNAKSKSFANRSPRSVANAVSCLNRSRYSRSVESVKLRAPASCKNLSRHSSIVVRMADLGCVPSTSHFRTICCAFVQSRHFRLLRTCFPVDKVPYTQIGQRHFLSLWVLSVKLHRTGLWRV